MSGYISLKRGDIVKEEADFIVNPSNAQLILGSGVSMAFRLHCGVGLQKLMQEAMGDGYLHKGDVVATDSLAPNFKYALHAAVMGYTSKNPYPTEQTILSILQNIQTISLRVHSPA